MSQVIDFSLRFDLDEAPPEVLAMARRLLLDLIGVAAAGRLTRLASIAADHAHRYLAAGAGGSARILFDGRTASPLGAAFAGAAMIDSFDAHDGHALTKGHAGVAILPALLAFSDSQPPAADDRSFLADLILGYEIATRSGMVLHASVADYHTSGAWNAIACAIIGARRLRLDGQAMREAIGIAEYHGPRSQMMRCIAHPTMVKDGSDWGALAGVPAALLAADGFTGAPAVTVEDAERQALWADLGARWRILEQYLKPYPVCRWAQPAVEAAAALMRTHEITGDDLEKVTVRSFANAIALGSRSPATTEQAQYSLPFPVAALMKRGRLGADEIAGEGLRDPGVLKLSNRIGLVEESEFTRRFPAERLAVVEIETKDGRRLTSAPTTARGDPDCPLTDEEVMRKFDALTARLDPERREAIKDAVQRLGSGDVKHAERLSDLILAAP